MYHAKEFDFIYSPCIGVRKFIKAKRVSWFIKQIFSCDINLSSNKKLISSAITSVMHGMAITSWPIDIIKQVDETNGKFINLISRVVENGLSRSYSYNLKFTYIINGEL